LIHRDFQSQNILVRRGEPVFIDYQGLRFGLAEYDLASLLYDPYVVLSRDQREELVALAEARSRNPQFRSQLLACACQRLMQALGAYGFLGVVKNKPTFLRHIRPALANLREVAVEQGILPILAPLLQPNDSAL
jgi:aminoglycoside/choline kinase family phosphotransferase